MSTYRVTLTLFSGDDNEKAKTIIFPYQVDVVGDNIEMAVTNFLRGNYRAGFFHIPAGNDSAIAIAASRVASYEVVPITSDVKENPFYPPSYDGAD